MVNMPLFLPLFSSIFSTAPADCQLQWRGKVGPSWAKELDREERAPGQPRQRSAQPIGKRLTAHEPWTWGCDRECRRV